MLKPNKIEAQVLKAIKRLLALQFANILRHRGVKQAVEQGREDYLFEQDFATNEVVCREMAKTSVQMNAILMQACQMMYQHGAKEITNFIDKRLPKTAQDLRKDYYQKAQAKGTDEARRQSANAFYNAKQRDGLNVSKRVWNLTQNSKKELEIIIQNGIKEGKTVDEISRSVRGYLNEPEKLFRRVKNKATGEMELSKAAQAYRPGQGVYRSSYKNAMRLVRTEMHRAYSEAKLDALRHDPQVKGYRVKLSNNHTTLINGKATPFHCICDDLQGEYPKDFDFHGWHPQCRCVIVPILISFDELRQQRKGKEVEQIKDVPQGFKDWTEKNREKIANPRLKNPLFLENNRKYWEGKNKPNALEVARLRHANRTPQQIQEIQQRWNERGKSIVKSLEKELKQNYKGVFIAGEIGKVHIQNKSIEKTMNINRGSYTHQQLALRELKGVNETLKDYKGEVGFEKPNDPNKEIRKPNIEGYLTIQTKGLEICLEKDKAFSKTDVKLYYIKIAKT